MPFPTALFLARKTCISFYNILILSRKFFYHFNIGCDKIGNQKLYSCLRHNGKRHIHNHQKERRPKDLFSFGRLSFYFLHRWTVRCIPTGFPHTDGGHRRNGYFVPVPGWSLGRIRAGNRKTDWHFDLVEEVCLNHMCFDSSMITSKRARKGFVVVVLLSEKSRMAEIAPRK